MLQRPLLPGLATTMFSHRDQARPVANQCLEQKTQRKKEKQKGKEEETKKKESGQERRRIPSDLCTPARERLAQVSREAILMSMDGWMFSLRSQGKKPSTGSRVASVALSGLLPADADSAVPRCERIVFLLHLVTAAAAAVAVAVEIAPRSTCV